MIWARTYGAFAILMALRGALGPLYQVGSNAMLADMLPTEKRDDGYATLRMGSNLGIALGPALGGVIISQSYNITFGLAAAGMAIFGLLILFQARETMPAAEPKSEKRREPWGGYPQVLRDGWFMTMILSLTLAMVPVTMMWTLLAVHATQNYGLPESQFGLIPTTNAALVVTLQIFVTGYTTRRLPFWMLALGALLYGLGVGSVALGRGFWGFWASMVIITCGELILMPTAATYAANLAPPDMRGRYMSIYSLAWTVAFAIGPVVGGFLSDNFGSLAVWYGGAAFGLASALSFVRLALAAPRGKRGSS
jgi:MFS family permease